MSIEADELVLYVRNDARLHERMRHAVTTSWYNTGCAAAVFNTVRVGVAQYHKEFCNPGDNVFTASDILGAAAELAEYYTANAKDM